MKWTYACPHCDAVLNPADAIILRGEYCEMCILIGFRPEPGNYNLFLPPGVEIHPGERWSFFCPVCGKTMTAESDDKLCSLSVQTHETWRTVLFSRIAGEQATFVVSATRLEEQHGPDADGYLEHLAQSNFMF